MSHLIDRYVVLMKILEIIERDQEEVLAQAQHSTAIAIESFAGTLIQRQIHIDRMEGDSVMGDKPASKRDTTVTIGEHATITSSSIVADSIRNSFNPETAAHVSDELRDLLKELTAAVGDMVQQMPQDQAEDAAEDFRNFVDQATRQKPKRKWWSVSVEGLTQAAKNLGKIGEPVISLLERIVPFLIKASA